MEITKEYIETNVLRKDGKTLNNWKVGPTGKSAEELYLIFSNTTTPVCACGKLCSFYTFTSGYRQTCGTRKCAANSIEGIQKKEATCLTKFGTKTVTGSEHFKNACISSIGVTNPNYSKECLAKRAATNEARGHQRTKDSIEDWELYKLKVWQETRKHQQLLQEYDKRGRLWENSSAYHIDHKLSISNGFKEGIIPSIVGCYFNLEMIPAKDNLTKRMNSSHNKEELYQLVNKPITIEI